MWPVRSGHRGGECSSLPQAVLRHGTVQDSVSRCLDADTHRIERYRWSRTYAEVNKCPSAAPRWRTLSVNSQHRLPYGPDQRMSGSLMKQAARFVLKRPIRLPLALWDRLKRYVDVLKPSKPNTRRDTVTTLKKRGGGSDRTRAALRQKRHRPPKSAGQAGFGRPGGPLESNRGGGSASCRRSGLIIRRRTRYYRWGWTPTSSAF